jgi:signal transduction histidine kinase
MPDEKPEPVNDTVSAKDTSVTNFSSLPPRLSFKAILIIFLSAGLLLFLLSRFNFLLIHTLIELSSIVLLVAVFLIGWSTRHLVRSQFFIILTTGFLMTGLIDLLHTLTYRGMQIFPLASADTATQLWLVARMLAATSFLCATASLGRREFLTPRQWLTSFVLVSLVFVALIWPLDVFPDCFIEDSGLTAFKVNSEYVIIILLCLSACLLWLKSRYLNAYIVNLLLLALGLSALSELLLTLYVDIYGIVNFLGHHFKLGGVILVYFALVEGSLRTPFSSLFGDVTRSYEELNLELQRRVVAEKEQQIAHQEVSVLYNLSRAMHRTLKLDELTHLILSAATHAGTGGFERATLFTVNRRTGTLQGMLGVSRKMSSLIIPDDGEQDLAWERLHLDESAREKQRRAFYNQKVIKLRLPLDRDDNALSKAFLDNQVVLVKNPEDEVSGGAELATKLELGPYACAPLTGRDQVIGLLLVDNHTSGQEISPQRERFLALFASLSGSALDNASLVKRLEMAHDNLQDVQEQLIHGEKMAVLGEMAAQVAHELRNPLVSIGGFAQRLHRQELNDAKANEYAGIIAREVRRMEEMLGNILSFSKKQLVCFEECRIGDVLREVFDLEYEHCQKQKIEIIDEINENLPVIVGDYRQLRQVFINLMINARQIMVDGGVLTVSARKASLRGEKAVVVAVEDTGGGISPEVLRNIFNPFFSTFAKGTGLGLSISHRIIAHHRGEIEVINAERGARFTITLPVAQSMGTKIKVKTAH